MRIPYLSALVSIIIFGSASALDVEREQMLAQQAMGDHLPEIAVERLRPLIKENQLPAETRQAVKRQLLEAMVRAGSPEASLIASDPDLADESDMAYWKGHAWRLADAPDEARALWTKVIADPASAYQNEARFALAKLFDENGKTGQAMRVLEPLLESGDVKLVDRATVILADIDLRENRISAADKRLARVFTSERGLTPPPRYLRVQLALKRDQLPQAIDQMKQMIAQPEGLTERVVQQTFLDLASVLIDAQQAEEAREWMDRFIDTFPNSHLLPQAFETLGKAGAFNSRRLYPKLASWSQSVAPKLRAYASYYTGVSNQNADQEAEALLAFQTISTSPSHPLRVEAGLKVAQIYLNRGEPQAALQVLTSVQEGDVELQLQRQIDFLKGQAQFARGDYEDALRLFPPEKSAKASVRVRSWFNASMAALKGGRRGAFEQAQESLRRAGQAATANTEAERLRGEVLLQKAIDEATSPETHAQAVITLKNFLRDFPNHEGTARARLTLAELGLLMSPRDLDLTEKAIGDSRFNPQSQTKEISEHLDYLEIWVASLRGSRDRVIDLSKAFLEKHSQSPFQAETLMKMAEAYFEKQDYLSARSVLDQLATEFPQSPLANQARFLAGRAALNAGAVEDAIDRWTKLVTDGDPSFQLLARHQQALALCQKGNWDDAIVQFNEILQAGPEDALLFRVLMAKGECLTIRGEKDPSYLQEALKVFDQVVHHPEVPPYWRDEASVRKGLIYRTLNQTSLALMAFQDVLDSEDNQTTGKPSSHWYYRAGFESLALLEQENKLEAALEIADKMGRTQGERAADARERAENLRLNDWNFDDD